MKDVAKHVAKIVECANLVERDCSRKCIDDLTLLAARRMAKVSRMIRDRVSARLRKGK